MTQTSFNTSLFPTWCPGCGDFGIWGSLKQALGELQLAPHQLLAIFGIGCSGNMSSFLKCNAIESLHGRGIPTAAGAKLANHTMPVIVIGGDGDLLGEGLGHFVHAARANYDITVVLHNNQLYGLTTGQASPTSPLGAKLKAAPDVGVIDRPLDPCALAIGQEAGFVARGFAGDMPHLTSLMKSAIKHPGFSLIDVLQPCVTFNKVNSYDWFRQRIKKVDHQAADQVSGLGLSVRTEDTIHTGILYQNNRPAYHTHLTQLKEKPLRESTGKKRIITQLLDKYR